MRLTFQNLSLQKLCESGAAMSARFGNDVGRIAQAQLADLRALPNLAHVRSVPWAVRTVNSSINLELPEDHELMLAPSPICDGEHEWDAVSVVKILGIELR